MKTKSTYSRILLCCAILFSISTASKAYNPVEIDSITQLQETCNLSNAQLTIHVSNVANPQTLMYSIDGGTTFTSSNHFTGLASGDFLILVTDGTLCTEVVTAQIADAPEPTLSVSSECIDGQNRSIITPDAQGGIAPYTFYWEGPNSMSTTNELILNAEPGDYYITVTDFLGCSFNDSITINPCCALELNCNLLAETYSCVNTIPAVDPIFSNTTATIEEITSQLTALGIIVQAGACGNLQVTANDTSTFPTDCTNNALVVTREYTIADFHSSFSCQQTFTVNDMIPTSLDANAESIVVLCEDNVDDRFSEWLAAHGNIGYTACSDPISLSTFPTVPLIDYSCNGSTEVIFVVEDGCGNRIESNASFTIIDDKAPEISCPNDIIVNPVDPDLTQQIENWISQANGTDNCSAGVLVHDYDNSMISADCDSNPRIPVTFSIEDNCGQVATCTSTISVVSPGAGVLICGQDLVIDCNDDRAELVMNWLAEFTGEDADGNSLVVDYTFDMAAIEMLNCTETLSVDFSMIDECGRSQNCLKQISINDDLGPVITCPGNIDIEITETNAETIVQDWLDNITAEDNCSAPITSHNFSTDISDLCRIVDPIVVVFFAADACGNGAECRNQINIIRTAPDLTCPKNLLINCGDDVSGTLLTEWASTALAINNNDNLITNNIAPDFSTISCSDEVDIVFTTSDNCGEQTSCMATITIIDEEPPSITCPEEIIAEIADLQLLNIIDSWMSTASAIDCNSVSVTNDFDIDFNSINCSETFSIGFTAEDACGLRSNCNSLITLNNQSEIGIICPESISVKCTDHNLEDLVNNQMAAIQIDAENAYEIIQNFDESQLDIDCESPESIEIGLAAIDICGNEDDCLTYIHVLPNPAIYIPNIFSPDGDGINDRFVIYSNESVDMVSTLVIYNRWGSKVYETSNMITNDDNFGWDGNFKGQMLSNQVFTYYAVILDTFGQEIEKVGTVQILKRER